MLSLREGLVRVYLKPRVESDLPGRLWLSFPHYRLLPEDAKPYLHYVREVLMMLPGVKQIELNPRIGTILARYDSSVTAARRILRWVDIVVDTGLEVAREMDLDARIDEEETAARVRRRLILRLPQCGKKEEVC